MLATPGQWWTGWGRLTLAVGGEGWQPPLGMQGSPPSVPSGLPGWENELHARMLRARGRAGFVVVGVWHSHTGRGGSEGGTERAA